VTKRATKASLSASWRETIPRDQFDITSEFADAPRPAVGKRWQSSKHRKKILKRLRALWNLNPSQTLGELIGDVFFASDNYVDMCFMSDKEFLDVLEGFKR
jgi:hypothetical protein